MPHFPSLLPENEYNHKIERIPRYTFNYTGMYVCMYTPYLKQGEGNSSASLQTLETYTF